MALDLPARFVRFLDREADALLAFFEERPVESGDSSQSRAELGSLVAAGPPHLVTGQNARRAAPVRLVGPADSLLGLEVLLAPGRKMVLEQVHAERAERLSRSAASRPELSDTAGLAFVRDRLVGWFEGRLKGETDSPFAEFLIGAFTASLSKRTLCVPIAGLHMQAPFHVGGIDFGFIDTARAESLVAATRQHWEAKPDSPLWPSEYEQKTRGRLNGLVYARCTVESVGGFATELASERVDEALELLGFWHPSATEPLVRLPLGRAGRMTAGRLESWSFDLDRILAHEQAVELEVGMPLMVSPSWLRGARGAGLAHAERLMGGAAASDLGRTSVGALRLYSRGLLLHGLDNRIAYAAVALETFLGRVRDRYIKRSLQRRSAVLLRPHGFDPDEVMAGVGRGYRLRSRFLHRGLVPAPEEVDEARTFLHLVWSTIALGLTIQRPDSKAELLRALSDEADRLGLDPASNGTD